jgi:hypothetical protein
VPFSVGSEQVPDAVQATLVLLQREPDTTKWKRNHDPIGFDDDANETGEEKVESWDNWNALGLMQQMGAIPASQTA